MQMLVFAGLILSLYEFARKGQILRVREETERLAGLDEEYGGFVSEVREMAGGFQLDELCEFLKPYLEEVDS